MTHDFYYSRNLERAYILESNMFWGIWGPQKRAYIKGQLYTHCVEHGSKEAPDHGDGILVGTGTYDDVTWGKPYTDGGLLDVTEPPLVIRHLFKFPIRHNDFNLLELVKRCHSLCDLSEYRQLRVHRNLVDNSITLEFIIPN